jgi:predicted transcriptional regulator
MKPHVPLRPPGRQVGLPPSREETHGTLDRPPANGRRKKSGRTAQFNIRVRPGFKARVEDLAESENRTIGAVLEDMLAVYEARGRSLVEGAVPVAEARAGRTRELRILASDEVFSTVGRVAAERGMSVSALIEHLLALEVARLDPHGGKFGVHVSR